MTLEELRAHCESNSAEPEDENEPYIIGYKAEMKRKFALHGTAKN